MFPSSSRVKLNRVALKDIVELKLAPRRRRVPRNLTADPPKQEGRFVSEILVSEKDTAAAAPGSDEPVQTSLTHPMGPASVTETPGNIREGAEPEKDETNVFEQSRKGRYIFKRDGPDTRGKHQQSKPNTRSKCRLNRQRKRRNPRPRLTRCVCVDSASVRRTEVNPRGDMSRRTQPGGRRPPAASKRANRQPRSDLKSGGRSPFKRVNIKREGGVTAVATSVGGPGGGGRSSGKAKAAGGEPPPAAAKTGRVPSTLTRLSNVYVNTEPKYTGLAGSEGYLRRAVGARCGLCGECKYISPQRKTRGKQGPKSTSPGPEPPKVEFKLKKESSVTENSEKIAVWIKRYPKVTLCDIAEKCDACSHNCGYVLPDSLKTKVVHCFKKDTRAGFRFEPGCFGHNKHRSTNNECCPSVRCEKPQSFIKHQEHLEEDTDSETLSSRATCHFHKSRTSEGSATRTASFSRGKRTNKDGFTTGVRDRDAEEDPGQGSDPTEAEMRRDKRVKLGNSVECSSTLGPAVKENCTTRKPCGQRNGPTKSGDAQMSSELFCQRDEVDTEEPQSFTCQRVRVYLGKIYFSCARTCMSWPFFKCTPTLGSPAATAAGSSGSTDPSARDNRDSATVNQDQPGSSRNRIKDVLPDTPAEAQDEGGERVLYERGQNNMSSRSDRKDTAIAAHLMHWEESLASLQSDTASFSSPSQHGRETGTDSVSASSVLVNGPDTDGSTSTPSPSALGLSDWETATTLSPMSSPFTQGGSSSLSATSSSLPPSSFLHLPKNVRGDELKAAEQMLFCCEETQLTSCSSSSSVPQHNSDSLYSSDSSLLLSQDKHRSDAQPLSCSSPPKLETYYSTSPFKDRLATAHPVESSFLGNRLNEHCVQIDFNEFRLPPLVSPVASPQSHQSFSRQSSGRSDEERKRRINKMLPQTFNVNNGNFKDFLEHSIGEMKGVSSSLKTPRESDSKGTPRDPQSSPSNDENVDDGHEEESQDETDIEDNRTFKKVPLDAKIRTKLTSHVLTETCSSPSSDQGYDAAFSDEGQLHSVGEEASSPSKIASSKRAKTKAEGAGESQPGILNEFTAYEQDILLVDMIHDDPELFENLPKQSRLKLGPTRVPEAPKRKPAAAVKLLQSKTDAASAQSERLAAVPREFHRDSPDISEESDSRPWRPQCPTTPTEWQNTDRHTKNMSRSNANNNPVTGGLERSPSIQTRSSPHNIPPLRGAENGSWSANSANMTEFRRHKSNSYCRQYFSESLSCGFKMCRFQHVPVEGDEKFCVETVSRFTKSLMCLQKAGAVFTGYYQSNPPGVYFSMPVLLCLLWAQLKAGMVSDVFSVLSVSLAHNKVPSHEFLLALFNLVREKGLMGFVPELMQLTYKMASAGLELSLDCLDCVKSAPVPQQTTHPNSLVSVSGNHNAILPEHLNLAHAIVEIELCTKQEDWKRMGVVFRSICQSSQHPNQLESVSGRIAIALLSESKDKRSLPFDSFAETVCQNEDKDSLVTSFVGRIGVSLMLRYHKTHQWAKGRRVVEIMTGSKVSFSTLKGLFGNENGASRCCLVTVATELFLLSGSVEGALNTLRENQWFLSCCSWPCEPADLESRTRVLIRLTEKTSHRDTLEVLCNLPGIKEPNSERVMQSNLIDIARYSPLFASHLQVCMDRQILVVASETVDFMLSKNLAVDHTVLQMLLLKLGKQNLWLRAREVFTHSLREGYYPGVSAPPGFTALVVPCRLGEVELALAFEMFIAVNATALLHPPETATPSLSITLKRTQSSESEYLSAGSRLLSAACIPHPKLAVHYTAVNSSQEQVFTLNVSSAQRWLRHNHLWASEVWLH